MRKTYWFGILIIIGFTALAFGSFRKALTPYVSAAEARKSVDSVQVAGDLVKKSTHYDIRAGELRFEISDKTGLLPVVYAGERPGNFDQATRVVVSGSWDKEHKAFRADKLLVKCPSKYQGAKGNK